MTNPALSQLLNTAKLLLLRFYTSVFRFPNFLSLSEVARHGGRTEVLRCTAGANFSAV